MLSSKIRILIAAVCFGILVPLAAEAQSCTMESAMAGSNIDIPLRMETGQTYHVRVNVFNSGTCTWDTRFVRLSIKIIRKPSRAPYPLEEFGGSEKRLRNTVRTRTQHTWYYDVKAPMYAGRYEIEWTMTNDGDPFGMAVRKTIEVNVP